MNTTIANRSQLVRIQGRLKTRPDNAALDQTDHWWTILITTHSGTNTQLHQRRGRRVEITPLTPPQSPPSHTSVQITAPAAVLSGTLFSPSHIVK